MKEGTVTIRQQAKDPSFPMMLFASVIAHIIALVVFIAAPGLMPRAKREPFGGPGFGGLDVMTVDFRLGESGKQRQEPAPPRYISKVKEEEEPLESKTSLPDPNKKKKEEPTATSTLNQPQRKTEGPFGAGKETKTEPRKSGKYGLGALGEGGGTGAFGTGTGAPFPFPWYIETVTAKIEINWAKPYITDTTPREYISVVYFVITRTGQVRQVQVEQSSGIAALDRSAESAILGAVPFPPLPTQWTEPELSFRLVFSYTR